MQQMIKSFIVFGFVVVLSLVNTQAHARTNRPGLQQLGRLIFPHSGRVISESTNNQNNSNGDNPYSDDPVPVVGANRIELCGTTDYTVRTYRIIAHTEQEVITALHEQTDWIPGSYVSQYYYGNTDHDKIHIPGASTAFFGSPVNNRTVPGNSSSSGLSERQFTELALQPGVNVFRFQVTAPVAGNFIAAICRISNETDITYIKTPNPSGNDTNYMAAFNQMAADENTLVLGMPGQDSGPSSNPNEEYTDSGAVYLFEKVNGTWEKDPALHELDFIKPDDISPNDGFGAAVALFGDTIFIAAPYKTVTDQNGTLISEAGVVYIYKKTNDSWVLSDTLQPQHPTSFEQFGAAIAANENYLAIGSPKKDISDAETNDISSAAGSVAIYKKQPDGSWQWQENLVAPEQGNWFNFGKSIAISNTNTLVVGMPGLVVIEDNFQRSSGAVYVYDLDVNGAYSLSTELFVSDSDINPSEFGQSLDIDGNTIVVGSPSDASCTVDIHECSGNACDPALLTNGSCGASGAAFVYQKNTSGVWESTHYVKATNTGESDRFGSSVSIKSGKLVVGAYAEDSFCTNPIDFSGELFNNDSNASGASYVYSLTDSSFSYMLKSPQNDSEDIFGDQVIMTDTAIYVLVPGESSPTNEINGQEDLNELSHAYSGAVYIFE